MATLQGMLVSNFAAPKVISKVAVTSLRLTAHFQFIQEVNFDISRGNFDASNIDLLIECHLSNACYP